MSIPPITFGVIATLAVSVAGCAGLDRFPSLGTYHVDAESAIVLHLEESDTIVALGFGDVVEVIDAPMEHRTSDDLYVVRHSGMYGRIDRDMVMADFMFRSKYTDGAPVLGTATDRFFLDEFRDTVRIRWQENVVEKPTTVDRGTTKQTEKPRSKKKRRR